MRSIVELSAKVLDSHALLLLCQLVCALIKHVVDASTRDGSAQRALAKRDLAELVDVVVSEDVGERHACCALVLVHFERVETTRSDKVLECASAVGPLT
jgi:hypothetical protein